MSIAPRPAVDLLAVFAEIGELDLGTSSRVDLLKAAARHIKDGTGSDAVEIAVTDAPTNDDPQLVSTDATIVSMPSGEVRNATRGESWWAGRLQAQDSKLTYREQTTYRDLDNDRGELIVPIRFTDAFFGAVRIVASRDRLIEREQWARCLYALTETLSARRLVAKRAERQKFYRDLVDVTSHEPSETSSIICRFWHKMSRADWTWLWLYNDYNRRYELAAFEGLPPPDDFVPRLDSAAAYAVDSGNVVMARGDFTKWVRKFKDREYRIAYAKLVNSVYGCKSFVCVPLEFPNATEHKRASMLPRIRGAVCLHYRDPHATPQQLLDSLSLMGRQCAQSIANTFLEEQRRILLRLTQMAQQHLTRVSRRPALVRAQYLKELIDLIRTDLQFQTVSLFYRRPFDDIIECVASTAISDKQLQRVADNRLHEITYRRDQGSTGKCFAEGRAYVVNKLDGDDQHKPVSFDIDPASGRPARGAVFCPIKQPRTTGAKPAVIGVIRCGGHRVMGTNGDGAARIGLHPVQVQTLELIAQQVGPMLQIFENNIRREQTISVVKHDLYSPLNMIRDTSERIADDLASGIVPREYDVKNLRVSHVIATNLVRQLDAEVGDQDEFHPEPTKLIGDILARVVNMLQHYAWTDKEMEILYNADDIINVIPILNIDRELIERTIHNVLINAIKYGRSNTKIQITARASRGGFLLDISNEGIGIEERDAKNIGQLHFRAETAKAVAQGVGLGMFIAKRAMERHGGQVFIHSLKDPTTFSLFFPKNLMN